MTDPKTPQPEPKADAPEPDPGGADSLDDPKYGDTPGDPVPRDLDPENNPAVEDQAPDEIKQHDDKKQEPDEGHSGVDAPGDEPADTSAQEEPEPPA
ncbi:MAG: hypothetical protein L0H93_05365 [Nocardioides sp.]|nr:hypothetical protein [Nocardioides sp.]